MSSAPALREAHFVAVLQNTSLALLQALPHHTLPLCGLGHIAQAPVPPFTPLKSGDSDGTQVRGLGEN